MKKLILASAVVASSAAYGIHKIKHANPVAPAPHVKACPSYPKTSNPSMQRLFDSMKKSYGC